MRFLAPFAPLARTPGAVLTSEEHLAEKPSWIFFASAFL